MTHLMAIVIMAKMADEKFAIGKKAKYLSFLMRFVLNSASFVETLF